MRFRWFRTAFWTLIACLGATTLLALRAPVQASQIGIVSLEPSVVRWSNATGRPAAGPVQPGPPADSADTSGLEKRMRQLETRVGDLSDFQEQLDYDHSDAIATNSRAIAAQRKVAARLAALIDGHSTLIAEQSRRSDALERRVASLRSDFDAHVALPMPTTETKSTVLLLSLPIPVSGPPVPVAPSFPEPSEYTPLETSVPQHETRTETISVQRVQPAPVPTEACSNCNPCWIGPCPQCGRYHSLTTLPPGTVLR